MKVTTIEVTITSNDEAVASFVTAALTLAAASGVRFKVVSEMEIAEVGGPMRSARKRARQQAFLAALAESGSIVLASDAAGIGHGSHYDWSQRDPEYLKRFEAVIATIPIERRLKPRPKLEAQTVGRKAAVVAAIGKLGTLAQATRAAGVARETHYEWMEEDSTYKEAISEALAGFVRDHGHVGANPARPSSLPERNAAVAKRREGAKAAAKPSKPSKPVEPPRPWPEIAGAFYRLAGSIRTALGPVKTPREMDDARSTLKNAGIPAKAAGEIVAAWAAEDETA